MNTPDESTPAPPSPALPPDAPTPRTDMQAGIEVFDKNGQPYNADLVDADFARQLERELIEAHFKTDCDAEEKHGCTLAKTTKPAPSDGELVEMLRAELQDCELARKRYLELCEQKDRELAAAQQEVERLKDTIETQKKIIATIRDTFDQDLLMRCEKAEHEIEVNFKIAEFANAQLAAVTRERDMVTKLLETIGDAEKAMSNTAANYAADLTAANADAARLAETLERIKDRFITERDGITGNTCLGVNDEYFGVEQGDWVLQALSAHARLASPGQGATKTDNRSTTNSDEP